jgi:glycosyltransferase involved in cell wall biosynthesis
VVERNVRPRGSQLPQDGVASLRVLATVTFNPNQLRAHLEPLLDLPEVKEVVLVADEQPPALPKLRGVVPPPLLVRIAGRAGAKLITCVALAVRNRPDWILGFNLVPHGINAVTVGSIVRRRSLYYMIGGAREWDGGGWSSDNKILGRLRRSSKVVESLLTFVIRRATAIAVMGEGGRSALISHGVDPARIHIIPASVDPSRFRIREANDPSTYDVLTIGALIERKRTEDFVRCVALTAKSFPGIRAAVAGTGPDEAELRRLAAELGVDEAVSFLGFREDTAALLQQSKVFMLTSMHEGLSIAVGEAMMSGLPVVVTDVGEMSSLVRDGVNGFLCPVGRPDILADRLTTLLQDDSLRMQFGQSAGADARTFLEPAAVGRRYREALLPTA